MENKNGSTVKPRFELGTVLVTCGISSRISEDEICDVLHRHECGHWEHMSQEEREVAEGCLQNQVMLECDYISQSGVPLVVTTNFRTKKTIVELPLDYLRDDYVEEYLLDAGLSAAEED